MRAPGYMVLALVLAFGCAPAVCQPPATNSPAAPVVLRDGTALHLTLARTVSSESDQPGELVEFIVKENLVAGTTIILAEGSSVYGKVAASRLADRTPN